MWKKWVVIIIAVIGMLFALPSLVPSTAKFIPVEPIPLGLDLKGGAQLLLEVDVNSVIKEKYEQMREDVRLAMLDRKNGQGVIRFEPKSLKVVSDKDYKKIEITLNVRNNQDAVDAKNRLKRALGRDVDVTTNGRKVSVKYADKTLENMVRDVMEHSISSVRRRIDAFGTKDPSIHSQGEQYILVQLPGVEKPEEIKDALGKTAKLSFHLVKESSTSEQANAERESTGVSVLPDKDHPGNFIPVYNRVEVSGDSLKKAEVGTDMYGRPVVSTEFDTTGTRKFAKLTTEHVGERFAIVLDGEVISSPVINEPIPGGRGQISGNFTFEEVQKLVSFLNSGALPAKLSVIEERNVGPGLGADTIAAGKVGSIVGILFILVFMVLLYRTFGLFADIVLIVNLIMIIGMSAFFGATLTLPGIAGIVLTLGMAVDANILPFERIRDEVKAGVPTLRAVDYGFDRSTKTVLDGELTNLICALILFQFGAGPIRGFAVTLSIGVVTTLFTCLLLTRVFVDWYMNSKNRKIGYIKTK